MSLLVSLLISTLTWPLFVALGLLLYLGGAFLVPFALLCGAYELRDSKFFPSVHGLFWSWPFMGLWSNEEDTDFGSPNYVRENGSLDHRLIALKWYFRNPVSGLRWAPILSCKLEQSKVQFIGSSGLQGVVQPFIYEFKQPNWWYAWCGPYSCIWIQFRVGAQLWRLWLGHKIYPADSQTSEYGYRQYGSAFAAQLKRVQTGNNKN